MSLLLQEYSSTFLPVGMPNSLLPRPNPLETNPANLMGYGASGSLLPAIRGRDDILIRGKTMCINKVQYIR